MVSRFDNTKNNSNNDTHVIIALSMKGLIGILATSETTLDVQNQVTASMKLVWKQSARLLRIILPLKEVLMEDSLRSSVPHTQLIRHPASFWQSFIAHCTGCLYRVGTHSGNGAVFLQQYPGGENCGAGINLYKIYPTVVSHSFTLSGLKCSYGQNNSNWHVWCCW